MCADLSLNSTRHVRATSSHSAAGTSRATTTAAAGGARHNKVSESRNNACATFYSNAEVYLSHRAFKLIGARESSKAIVGTKLFHTYYVVNV